MKNSKRGMTVTEVRGQLLSYILSANPAFAYDKEFFRASTSFYALCRVRQYMAHHNKKLAMYRIDLLLSEELVIKVCLARLELLTQLYPEGNSNEV